MTKIRSIIKIFLKAFWIFSWVLLLPLFYVVPKFISTYLQVPEYQRGQIEVTDIRSTNGNYRSGTTSLYGVVNDVDKSILLDDYKEMKLSSKDFPIGSKHKIWFHTESKSAYFNFDDSEKFELPRGYVKKTYSFILACCIPLAIFSLIRFLLK